MKIIVLHGEDLVKSYGRLLKFIETAKARSWEVVYVDELPQTLQEILTGASLFGAERFFILKDVKRLAKKELDWLKKKYADLTGNLVIYHEGVLSQTFLKSLPKDTKVELFDLPKLIWKFLDDLYPGNSQKTVKEFHEIIERDAAEFVFTLIARHFRDLYWVKVEPASLPYQSWRVGKLKKQANNFSIYQLKDFITELSKIDIEVKTGKNDLVSALDLLLIKQLE